MNSKAQKTKAFDAVIWTEGKTDWMHLKRAMEVLGINLNIRFEEYTTDMGSSKLLAQCENSAKITPFERLIYIFDRDEKNIVEKVADIKDPNKEYKSWGNNVFSFPIPVPQHRREHKNLCIEFYYTDKEITTKDSNGRRIFLSSEFKELSGKHKDDPLISLGSKGEVKNLTSIDNSKIIDGGVYNGDDENIALTKTDFADCILRRDALFKDFNFDKFKDIFSIIEKIIEDSSDVATDLFFYKETDFNTGLTLLNIENQVAYIINEISKVCKIAIYVFVGAVIRYYESEIVNEPLEYRKKVRGLKTIISDDFREPSLSNLCKLLRSCYHLVDNQAPKEIIEIKACFGEKFQLGILGEFLDYFEVIFPLEKGEARTINRSTLSQNLLDYVLPKLSKYEDQFSNPQKLAEEIRKLQNVNTNLVNQALRKFRSLFEIITRNNFSSSEITRVGAEENTFISTVTSYLNGKVIQTEKEISQNVFDARAQYVECNILVFKNGNQISLNLFPFLIIKDGKIFFYKQTRAAGYEFNLIFGRDIFISETKRKFSRSVFSVGLGDQQQFFWTDVLPSKSKVNGMCANIPVDTLQGNFIGRKKQIEKIFRNVIEIPNENGIIFGPGGVGKTALMIELSNKIFQEEDKDKVLFDNLIWVSAKRDYYNPVLNIIEKRPQQFSTLDDIFSAIFEFFKYDNLDNYEREDRKSLIIDILKTNKVLLILDNFETVSTAEQEAIVDFFGVEVKRELRKYPDYFKILITAREQIPSGFHQIELKGLDQRESKLLMKSLFETYKDSSKEQLSPEQQSALYKVTSGIPLIINHCYAQIYDYNSSVKTVIDNLTAESTKIIDFSFSEIFQLLKQDSIQLKTIILLELVNTPLLLRQIADVLKVSESNLENKLTRLVSFQCIKLSAYKMEEKYSLNDEMRLFTKRITQNNPIVTQEIKQKIEINFSLERRMDYTQEEHDVASIFDKYVSENHFREAEDFIKDELKKDPRSILLNYKYAKYLHEANKKTNEAIQLLESIRREAVNDPLILQLLVAYYSSLDIPNFREANNYARDLKVTTDENILLVLAEFYVKWSTSIKMQTELDPIKEIYRQQEYKQLADEAIQLLNRIAGRTHYHFYLMAQSHYNKWNYQSALSWINQAIEALPPNQYYRSPYTRFRKEIMDKQDRFGK